MEYDYLSSANRLLEFQNLYFENELLNKDIKKIKIIDKQKNNLEIKNLEFADEN